VIQAEGVVGKDTRASREKLIFTQMERMKDSGGVKVSVFVLERFSHDVVLTWPHFLGYLGAGRTSEAKHGVCG